MAKNFMLEESGLFLEVICVPRHPENSSSDYFVLEVTEETPYGVAGEVLKQGEISRLAKAPSEHSLKCYCKHHTKAGDTRNVVIPWSRVYLAYSIYEYDCMEGDD